MYKLFLELIRVSIGQLDCLSRGPEPEEWYNLYEMAQHQHMVGICYHGVQKLFEFGLRVPQDLVIEWMAKAEEIEQQNVLFNERCIKVQEQLTDKIFKSSILAGQGAAHDYSEELQTLREPIAIDIYANGGYEELTEFAERLGYQEQYHDYRRIIFTPWDDGSELRLHYHLGIGKNPFKNKAFALWLEKNRKALYVKDGAIVRPSVTMNVIYTLVSFYWLFLYQSITLREMMDLFFALKRLEGNSHAAAVNYEKVLRSLGILHFSQGIMWVMQDVFDLKDEALIVKPLESKGSFILNEVLSGSHRYFRLFMRYPVEMIFSLF